MSRVRTGLERVLSDEAAVLRGKRIGLIANPTAVNAELAHAVDLLANVDGVELAALFGPEHGLRSEAQDMIAVGEVRDPRTGLIVYSLYGADEASLTPTDESLAGLDALVFDIQDVGSRYYTYVWTMVLAMRACARHGIEMVVLDRPNPIGGDLVEGGAIAPGYESFVGLCSVPNRHGMTAGEIAIMMRARESLDVALSVVSMEGWSRSMQYADTGLPWVMPSPNMPTYDTALVYPGMCLVEGTELSEGRGTTRPFELAGAGFVDGAALAEALASDALPGLVCRPLSFRPTFQKFGGESCGGVQLHVTNPRSFRPYLTGVAFVAAVQRLYPEQFAWRVRAYEFVDDKPAFDLLTGGDQVRQAIEAGAPLPDIARSWVEGEEAFRTERSPHLLY